MPDAGPLNRELQLAMLRAMAAAYPREIISFGHDRTRGISDDALATVLYLQEHALCEANVRQSVDGHFSWGGAKITAKGLDFLADDGGLTAILGVVTVKLHADTVRELIEAKVDAGPGTPEEKVKAKSFLRRMSEEGLQMLTRDLMRRGLDHVPDVPGWLSGLGHG